MLSPEESRKLRLLEARLNPICAASRSPCSSFDSSPSLDSAPRAIRFSRSVSQSTSDADDSSQHQHILVKCGGVTAKEKESLRKAAELRAQDDDVASFSSEPSSSKGGPHIPAEHTLGSCDIARDRSYAPAPSHSATTEFDTPLLRKEPREGPNSCDEFLAPPAPARKKLKRKRVRSSNTGSPHVPSSKTSRVDDYFKPALSSSLGTRTSRPAKNSERLQSSGGSGSSASREKPCEVRRELSFPSPSITPSPTSLVGEVQLTSHDRPADAFAHFRRAIDDLKTNLCALEQRNDALSSQNKELLSENEDLRAQLDDLNIVKSDNAELKERYASLSNRCRRLEDVVCNVLKEAAMLRRNESKRKAAEASHRLGKVVTERKGTGFSEVWQDGYELIENRERLQQILVEREVIEHKRRDLAKTRKSISSTESVDSGAKKTAVNAVTSYENTPEYVAEVDETLKLQSLALKREESQLLETRSKMLTARDCLFREITRQNDEGVSVFGKYPKVKERYLLLNLLGRGGFSEVFRAFDLEESRFVACKIHQLASNWSENRKQTFLRHMLRENEIHQSLSHPRILRAYDSFELNNLTVVSVLELCEGTDLDVVLRKSGSLPEREARSIISQVFAGLEYLDQNVIVHYDLKPGNILLHNGQVRITDFGLSK